LEVLLAVGRFDPAQADVNLRAFEDGGCTRSPCHRDNHAHDSSRTFSSWFYESERPLSLEALREVLRQLPSRELALACG